MIIQLEDIHFYAYHGVYEQERRDGNDFLVTVRLDMPESKAVKTDQLADTVSYEDVYALVAHEMAIPSQLLEHVAGRIRNSLEQAYPYATIHVQIKKKNPPVGGDVAWATIEI
ncbi:MAG: dihydroneopterin aldolase [Paludibacteraceae bacterium]|nr:dihydroneopterin aldolase [Paludibacteraceae bacterium]